jgi:hypothetical protein
MHGERGERRRKRAEGKEREVKAPPQHPHVSHARSVRARTSVCASSRVRANCSMSATHEPLTLKPQPPTSNPQPSTPNTALNRPVSASEKPLMSSSFPKWHCVCPSGTHARINMLVRSKDVPVDVAIVRILNRRYSCVHIPHVALPKFVTYPARPCAHMPGPAYRLRHSRNVGKAIIPPIERHARVYLGVLHGAPERQGAAHAETDHAHLMDATLASGDLSVQPFTWWEARSSAHSKPVGMLRSCFRTDSCDDSESSLWARAYL